MEFVSPGKVRPYDAWKEAGLTRRKYRAFERISDTLDLRQQSPIQDRQSSATEKGIYRGLPLQRLLGLCLWRSYPDPK